jgi:hypothetical protein
MGHGRTKSFAVRMGILLSGVLLALTVSPQGMAMSRTHSIHPLAQEAPGCDAKDPVGLLLPPSAIPGLKYGGRPYGSGGGPISIFGAGSSPESRSVAAVAENLYRPGVPVSELDGEGQFEVSHPHTIVKFDEGITGFANSAAEAMFFNEEQGVPELNFSSIPTPNIVTTDGFPNGAGGVILSYTIQFGDTVLGMEFTGGQSLSWPDVAGPVRAAIHVLEARCPGGEIG